LLLSTTPNDFCDDVISDVTDDVIASLVSLVGYVGNTVVIKI